MDITERTERLLPLEFRVEQASFDCGEVLRNKPARAHMRRGFASRHYLLRHCREHLGRRFFEARPNALSADDATLAGLLVNAYYLNLRGALDNLAWTLQHEVGLLDGVEESSPHRRGSVYLFGSAFKSAIRDVAEPLADYLEYRTPWANDLRMLRDPAAHRIPLTVPGVIFTSESQMDEFRRIEAQAGRPHAELGGRTRSSILREAQNVGSYEPIFMVESQESLVPVHMPSQLLADHQRYLGVAWRVTDQLLRLLARQS